MGYIAVDNLKQGMVLSRDVHDINTRLLLSKGQKIEPKHIRILRIWGVMEVNVVGAEENAPTAMPAFDSEEAQRVKRTIGRVFKNLDLTHPMVNEICQASLASRLQGDFKSPPAFEYQSDLAPGTLCPPEQIKRQIQKIDVQLPAAPTIIEELNSVITDPFATSNDVAQVVNKSPSLAALLLRIVNSAYYGFPSKIDRISRAVTIIGTKEISGLALGISVMRVFSDIPKEVIDMQAFIRHSLACGMLARILAALKNLQQTEQLFVSGLLHDIGKLVVFKYYPEYANAYLHLAAASGSCVFDTEKEVIGMNHTTVGHSLLERWNLPVDLSNNVVFHHAPSRAFDPVRAGIIQLADLITHGLGVGGSGELSVPGLDYSILEKLKISTNSIQTVVRQAAHQLGPMEAIFNG